MRPLAIVALFALATLRAQTPAHGFAPAIPLLPNVAFHNILTVTADFNHDGQPDLALTDTSQTGGLVLLSNGDGTFQPPIPFATPGRITAIATGDFNSDGNADLVITGAWDGITFLPGLGDGTFLSPITTPGLAPGATSIAVADFNLDGIPDLAIGDNNVGVYLGRGDATFQNPALYENNGYFDRVAVAVGDFNGDGRPDLVAAGASTTLVILLGRGDGTFTSMPALRGAGPGLAIGDLNHDGISDFMTSFGQVFLGNGDGTFRAITGPFGSPGIAALLIDLDGDGNLDGAFIVSSTVVVFLGNGDGTFQRSQIYYVPTPSSLVAGDFNSDGRIDLVAGASLMLASEGRPTTTTLEISPNPSVYGQPVTLTATVTPADVTGTVTFFYGVGTAPVINGRAQLTTDSLPVDTQTLQATYNGDVRYAPSNSIIVNQIVIRAAPSLSLTPSANPIPYGQNLTIAATLSPTRATGALTLYDGATILGVQPALAGSATFTFKFPALGTHTLTISYGGDANTLPAVSPEVFLTVIPGAVTTPAITLKPSANPAIYNQPVTLTATLGKTATGTVTFFLGPTLLGKAAIRRGRATLTTRLQTSGVSPLKAIYSGDANFTTATSTPFLEIVKTVAVAGFDPPVTSATGGIIPTLTADFNADGNIDLAGLTSDSPTAFGILLGHGDGTFLPAILTRLPDAITKVALTDFNGDGIPDLAILHGDPSNLQLAILLGNGDGTFRLAVDHLFQYATAIAVADFDVDGKPDIAVASYNGINVLTGNGDGTFQPPVVSVLPASSSGTSLSVGDLNGDGIPDLFISGIATESFWTILLGNGDSTFQPHSAITIDAFTNYRGVQIIDLNGDGLSDIVFQTSINIHGHIGYSAYALLSTRDGTPPPSAIPAYDFLLADFNGDGILDVLNGNLYAGNGDGTFQPPIPLQNATAASLAADVNGDGRLDLINTTADGSIVVSLGH